MQKIIEKLENGITRVTVCDERWYQKDQSGFVPSVTWIAGHYPKGTPFYKWLAEKGWDEAEAIKSSAGNKGSKVHSAIEDLILGKEIKMDSKYMNRSTEQLEELSLEEYECLMSFADWFNATKPKVLRTEFVVFNDKEGYGGTVDLTCEIDGKKYIVDFKTGQNVWPEYELQLSAYKHAHEKPEEYSLAVLQIGYRRNKNKWKWTEFEDKYDLFLAAKKIWQNECGNQSPRVKDYPETIKLNKILDKIVEKVEVAPIKKTRKVRVKKAV